MTESRPNTRPEDPDPSGTRRSGTLGGSDSSGGSGWSDALLEAEFPEFADFEPLGRGGFASVFTATHPRLGRIALKVLTGADHWDVDEAGRRSFWHQVETETKAIGSLSAAPTIVTLHTSGTSRSGWPYLVMELCPGGSVKDLIRRRQLVGDAGMPLEAIIDVGVAVGTALATAHDQGILHLDVKPANILVNRFGTFQLSDFGIARSINDAPPDDDASFLTPHFAAPELWDSASRPQPATDVFGLGATLYQMATLRRPFEGSSGTELADRVRAERPVPVDPTRFPVALSELVAACLEKDPALRPHPRELVSMLRGLSVDEAADDTRTLAVPGRHGAVTPPSPSWPEPGHPLAPPSTPDPADRGVVPAEPATIAAPLRAPVTPPSSAPPAPVPSASPPPGASAPRPQIDAPWPGDSSHERHQDRGRERSRRRVGLVVVVLVASLVAIVVRVATSTSDAAPPVDRTLSDDELRAGATGDIFPTPDLARPAPAPTAETPGPGVPTSVQLGPVDEGRALLSWTLEDPLDAAEYVVLAARFPLDPTTALPTPSPLAQGLLSPSGSLEGDAQPVARMGSDQRSISVTVDPSELTCFAVVLVTTGEGVPSPSRPCSPAAPPAPPAGVDLRPADDGSAVVTWTDRSADESRFRILGIRDQNGRQEVVESVTADADATRATVTLHANACYVVRAENAANTLPATVVGQPRPGPEGQSLDDVCP